MRSLQQAHKISAW